MSTRSFLIVHGLNGSGEGHWQRWLYDELIKNGESVLFPQFPSNDKPNLEVWLSILKEELRKLTGERIVICHSMGAVLWFHLAAGETSAAADRVLLVAPPSNSAIQNIKELEQFKNAILSNENLMKVSKYTKLVVTDNDEYCPEKGSIYFGEKLKIPTDILPDKAGHINLKSNYGAWPSVLEWCYNSNITIKEK